MQSLTVEQVRSVPLTEGKAIRKLQDGGGLHLLIDARSKAWRFRYRFAGKDALLSLGVYPDVGLERARTLAAECRTQLEQGQNPSDARRKARDESWLQSTKTFGVVAAEYNASRTGAAATLARCRRMYKHSRKLHGRTFAAIERPDVLGMCETRGRATRETAHRLAIYVGQVFTFARDKGYFKGIDPTIGGFGKSLSRMLGSAQTEHAAALTDPQAVGALMRVISSGDAGASKHPEFNTREAAEKYIADNDVRAVEVREIWSHDDEPKVLRYAIMSTRKPIDWWVRSVTPTTGHALELLARTATRPGPVANAEWSEFDLDGERHDGHPTWIVPLHKMKMKDDSRTDHVVPLSTQAVTVMRAQEALTGGGKYVFPNERSDARPMSDSAMSAALLALGYRDQHEPRGFRTTFSTLARDVLKAESELIDRQLAHKIGSDVRGAYDRSQRLSERRALMQNYSDLLDRLRDG